ncbi:MAG: hypothetical protein CL762_05025 [Chloroflexi bacterium]|nr:hypothetical protein [Chloroflexota bacterium]|tara:strand:+ start:9979 stop:10668 length:690 start_codon:yes stop_codon:yes gene_type:complete
MSEELGKIEKPSADNSALKRKLYLVQNIQNYFPESKEFKVLLEEYWASISEQLDKLEKTAGIISHIYIEGMWQEFDEASKAISDSNPDCINLVKERVKSGSKYIPIENENIYKTLIDWTRIAQLGFISEDVKKVVEDNYSSIAIKREEYITDKINELKESEAALFIISSGGHKFTEDIEMFNIIPPTLDKMNRWIQDNQESLASQSEQQKEVVASKDEDPQEKSNLWTP